MLADLLRIDNCGLSFLKTISYFDDSSGRYIVICRMTSTTIEQVYSHKQWITTKIMLRSFFYGFLNPFSHFLSGTLFANIWISEQGANYGMGHILSGVSMQFATALFASNYSNKISY